MVRGKGYFRLRHYRNERQQLDLNQQHPPQQNNIALTNGDQRPVSLPVRILRNSFRMLSFQRPEAAPVAAMKDQDEGQNFGLYLEDEKKSQCKITVASALPDIDPEYLARVCAEAEWDPNRAIDQIFDEIENGNPYPRVPKQNSLKRKRDEDEEPSPENAAAKFDNEERRQQMKATSYKKTCDMIMQQSFPEFYAEDLRRTFAEHGNCLYPAFLAVAATVASSNNRQPYRKKSRVTQPPGRYDVDALAERIRTCDDQGEREALEEFRALREVQAKQRAESEVERKRQEAEKTNLEIALLEGNVADCGCCFVEHALNRMVHCDGDTLHWFCRDCARMMAETQIGLSKYSLDCMSTDGCAGGFSMDQKEIFLDKHSMTALDRIEQEAVLREAGIENLETCPQCPFAAEYPPIEENKEFQCLNPDCAVTSCRSCRKETHVPKTCAEAALDNGHTARHEIEEAMSAALIRTCNKCSAPFIKENGCNKMTCTKCRNIQCYVCSKSCDYSHFNDTTRGGKTGNCPLFDGGFGVEQRHQQEVRAAEELARKRALEKHPEVQADLLEFQLSDKVKKDEEEKASAHPQHIHHRHHFHHHRPGARLARMVRFNIGREQALEQAQLGGDPIPLIPIPIAQPPGDGGAAGADAPPLPIPGPFPIGAPPHLREYWDWDQPIAMNAQNQPQLMEAIWPEIDGMRPLLMPFDNPAGRKPPPLVIPRMLRRRAQASRAPAEVAPAAPAIQGVDRLNPLPQEQEPHPVEQALRAQAQPYINPRAVFENPPAPAVHPGVDFYNNMHEMNLVRIEGAAVDRLLANYRQGEHPQASPVGNGQIGDANQMDHRPLGDGVVDGQAMNDGAVGWHTVLPVGNLGDPPALDFDNLPRLDDLAPMQFPAGDYGWDGSDFNFDQAAFDDAAAYDGPPPFGGPDAFGFDDLAFR